jgi:hypothetical protein
VGRSRQELKDSAPTATKPSAMRRGLFFVSTLKVYIFLKNRRSERPVQALISVDWTITTSVLFSISCFAKCKTVI